MCNIACTEFGRRNLKKEDIMEKSIIEVGSRDVNGSLRPIAEAFKPHSYIGVDIQMGHGVDQICDAHKLLDRFGRESFDMLISTELLEHVRDWRKVITNFKHVLKPEGILIITTRSKGFYGHDLPFDFWRYELSDMQIIFSDFSIEVIEKDPLKPGVFIKARKPGNFIENNLANHKLYSIIKGKRTLEIKKSDRYFFDLRRFLWLILPRAVKNILMKRKFIIPWLKWEDFYK